MSFEEKIKIILDAEGKEVVQMNMDVFKAIESYIEDNGLLQAVLENDSKDKVAAEDAMAFYSQLKKEN